MENKQAGKKEEVEPDHSGGLVPNESLPNGAMSFKEEMGADFAYGMPVSKPSEKFRYEEESVHSEADSGAFALGWIALVFSIASLFLWPVLLAPTAMILGYMAYKQGARGLGGWSVAIGLLVLAIHFIITPIYYALVG
ncbi:DUF4190 domain-containing protein [Paenibacillus sp. J5C_2022]|uniref:DUF4190 domain-containing protein n=1 Tax=Paenibacillus sp. J5C2022 TaxID=2977129 RepID=UPI0021CF4CF8|nr:DUF4190 domain-containing protein [Paenibacillus sp. J5C2022]MCU6707696.1 DUF4190 domain-containing protein [Paenibacillus sp. J5C2022]